MPDRHHIRLLIVEDDEDDFVLASSLLEHGTPYRFTIDWASTPLQARRLFQEQRHDLCLMDYRLGGESGIDLVREISSLRIAPPIIMLTGQEDAGVEIAAARAGAVDYLVKDNLSRDQLLRALRYALARREIQAEREERQLAETANKAKTEFLATLSHEIRTPLSAIIGHTELLMYQHASQDPALRKKLGVIKRNGAHLLSLLNDTLDLSKIEAGKLEMDISEVQLDTYLYQVMGLLQEVALEKGLAFTLSAEGSLPAKIHTDPMRLRQILLNLLGNALKFTHQGEVGLRLRCRAEDGGHVLEFQVHDTGVGIHGSKLQHIFEPFTQLDTDSMAGSGLGLTISLKLAENLGGGITAISEPGAGSCFVLRIDPGPITLDPKLSLTLPVLEHEEQSVSLHDFKGRVLIVDDVADIRDMLEGLLHTAGIECDSFGDAQTALAHLQQAPQHYAAVLMDLNMPGLDGYCALRELRTFLPELPVIALTAAGLKGERARCLQAGFTAFLPKPVTLDSLLTVLQQSCYTAPASELEASRPTDATIDVLVVEDNADANAAMCELLGLLGQRAVGALTIAAARTLFATQRPALVIADVHLNDGNGLELLTELHARAPEVRLCLATGDQLLRDKPLPAAVQHLLLKPITLAQLEQLLHAP